MSIDTRQAINKLIDTVAAMKEITAIGQTGEAGFIPEPGKGDIDIFVFGETIPGDELRKEVYDTIKDCYEECYMKVCEGGNWGTGDIFLINGVETMLMYFQIDDTLSYLDEVLAGTHLDCDSGFYPIGRCATLKTIHVLYDEVGFLVSVKDKLALYPVELQRTMLEHHLNCAINEEDLGRTLMRKDVLFYHQVLENAIDHYLLALYAANKTYFPSRKRTLQYIDGFQIKPDNCYERLLELIRNGSTPEGIEASCQGLYSLVKDLRSLTIEKLY